jgi:predicted N-acyltransferase
MTYTARHFQHVEEIDPAAWNKVTEGYPFAGHAWFRFLEAVTRQLVPRYTLLYDSQGPVAAASYLLDPDPDMPVPDPLRTWVDRYLDRHPLLSCQIPEIAKPGLFVPAHAADDGTSALAMTKALIQAGQSLARQAGCSFLLYNLLSPGTRLALLEKAGLASYRYTTEPGTVLTLQWPNFDAYLAHFPRKRRKDLRRSVRLIERAGIEITVEADPRPWAERFYDLLVKLYAEHGSAMPFSQDLAHQAYTHLGDQAPLLVARRHGKVIGCGFCFCDGDTLLLRILGLDKEEDPKGHGYRGLFFEAIRYAIARGLWRIDAGSTAYTWKRRLGFEMIHSTVCFTSPRPGLQLLGQGLAKFL